MGVNARAAPRGHKLHHTPDHVSISAPGRGTTIFYVLGSTGRYPRPLGRPFPHSSQEDPQALMALVVLYTAHRYENYTARGNPKPNQLGPVTV